MKTETGKKESIALYVLRIALTLVVTVLLILNVIWKRQLMKAEKQLIEEGKAVS